jgi:predicted DNA-binding transcriptional regulator AlpA
MMKHHGRLIEYSVRNSALNISEIAHKLNVNRSTIYHWFQKDKLAKDIIFKLGNAIRYDFSIDFPEFFTKADFTLAYFTANNQHDNNQATTPDENDMWKIKYLLLLEEHKLVLERYAQEQYAGRAS